LGSSSENNSYALAFFVRLGRGAGSGFASGRTTGAGGDAELAQAPEVMTDDSLPLVLRENRRVSLVVGLPGAQNPVDEQQHGMGDRHELQVVPLFFTLIPDLALLSNSATRNAGTAGTPTSRRGLRLVTERGATGENPDIG
jgi:hypothetical protein